MLISERLLSAIAIAALSAPATAALLVILSRYSARVPGSKVMLPAILLALGALLCAGVLAWEKRCEFQ